ncbi:MAG: transcription antitermination factor NusB [Lachnospiraceae bacterium]|nr:transcription antitermination factor NusB [Lachnospiraceae bacterium]
MRRRECREQIFRLLFQVEFNDKEEYPELAERFRSFQDEENSEPEEGSKPEKPIVLSDEENDYVSAKYEAITERIEELDDILNETSTDWKTDRMGKVELAILRLALFEMKYDDDIPESVAINEAVELAKKYGPEESYAFVNGVLAKCAKDASKHKEAESKKEKGRPWKNKADSRIVVKGSASKKE